MIFLGIVVAFVLGLDSLPATGRLGPTPCWYARRVVARLAPSQLGKSVEIRVGSSGCARSTAPVVQELSSCVSSARG